MVRVATFNLENLFARYRFASNFAPTQDGFTINNLAFDLLDETSKQITGKAIKHADADVFALQEIESLPVLDRFNSRYLGANPAKRYPHRVLIDGNDPRAIDVGLIARAHIEVRGLRTHRDRRRTTNRAVKIFSRDCLEVDLEIPHDDTTAPLTLFINHYKSMMGGREETADRRREQVEATLEIVETRFPDLVGNFMIIGDFNDYPAGTPDAPDYTAGVSHPLHDLLEDTRLVNTVAELVDDGDSWTHFFAREDQYTQLDYIMVSRTIWERAGNGDQMSIDIVRDGLPFRADRYTGPRLDNVGDDEPKASDHCPVVVEFPSAALRG